MMRDDHEGYNLMMVQMVTVVVTMIIFIITSRIITVIVILQVLSHECKSSSFASLLKALPSGQSAAIWCFNVLQDWSKVYRLKGKINIHALAP